MDSLTLNLNKELLLDLMKNFHMLTGIKIAFFDAAGEEILSYPEGHCRICGLIRENKETESFCLESNAKYFKKCQATKTLQIFHCHAGLIETAAPLIDNDAIIGYVMFGQITDIENEDELKSLVDGALRKYKIDPQKEMDDLYSVSYKPMEQIEATSKILEACTFYVLLKDMISLQRETFIENFNKYLLDHLSEDLSIDRLAEEFHVSRNNLYLSCGRFLPTGIAEHIKNLRIKEAKRLLVETDLSVHEISDKVGFNDYNYFCRVFKAKVGLSAKKYKNSYI